MNKPIVLALVLLVAAQGIGYGEDNNKPFGTQSEKKEDSHSVSEKKFTPIEVRKESHKKAPDYYYEGIPLKNLEVFKAVIDPLNDPEASRLLNSFANNDSIGTVFIVVGGLLCASGIIYLAATHETQSWGYYYGPSGYSESTLATIPPDRTPVLIMGVGGLSCLIFSVILKDEAASCRQKAVERYNHVVESEQDLSLFLVPDLTSPTLRLAWHF